MSEHLVFPSNVMEHLNEEQIELLYERYLSRTLTRALMNELNVSCHISHIISHFPYVEADTEHECLYCKSKIYTKRKNVVGNGVDWGICDNCGHKVYLNSGDTLINCSCVECKKIQAAQERSRREETEKLESTFWRAFQENNTIATDEYGGLDYLSQLDVYATHLIIKSGYVDENGTLDPVNNIQKKLLLFPTQNEFIQYIKRMFEVSAMGYAWTEYTKNEILNAHINSFDQREYLKDGSHWPCFDSVHLRLTIADQYEDCDCDTDELIDLCDKHGCRKRQLISPAEVSQQYHVHVATPNKPCINPEEEFWKTIQSLQLMQLKEFLQATEKIVDFPILQEELPAIYETMCSALKRYSPSRCAYLINKALKDAVVFSRSEKCKGKTHACRTIKNNITRLIEKANTEGWEPTSYGRLKYSVVPKIAQSFYSEVLGFVDENDPSWYMNVEDIRERLAIQNKQAQKRASLSPDNGEASAPIDVGTHFMPVTDEGKQVFTQLLEEFTCVNCQTTGYMQIGGGRADQVLLYCINCKSSFRYKLESQNE
ncbi:hypothetical protein [Marinomonas transparens]|uniref:Uncharacterized protein n=1 Tax=Marinomonas transparens TaxID=2795388 RepID=A0A934N3I3_9GAMM|nr:hypothetical protein [Marinomonas transparens]MBJ7539722.1 hypothetical protein [Marinomonas transparens]